MGVGWFQLAVIQGPVEVHGLLEVRKEFFDCLNDCEILVT